MKQAVQQSPGEHGSEKSRLTCPRCGAEMRAITTIDDQSVIHHILKHLGKYAPKSPDR